VNAAKSFIADQLRSFTRQEHGSGRFVENPEYPEFPWVEGIINAVAHRDYDATGQFILVRMFDDRLEIESPGRFPDIVTADNITHTRFSRNKTISRVMTEFEWVREVNEGVKKIYADMAEAGLPAPEFIEMPNTVKLILRNNIDERLAYRNKAPNKALNEAISEALNEAERQIINVIIETPSASQIEIAEMTGFSRSKVQRIMKELTKKKILYREGARKNGAWRVLDE
jgi:ATP-dependent DNA helicase RecG